MTSIEQSFKVPQLLLRIALGVSFLSAVGDRLGFLGAFGNPNIAWGNWDRFIDYTQTMMPFLERPAVNIMGGIATVAEVVIGMLLIIGFKTRLSAMAGCVLTLIFALAMALFSGIKAPLNFSVFTAATASLLLAKIPVYDWSIDQFLIRKAR